MGIKVKLTGFTPVAPFYLLTSPVKVGLDESLNADQKDHIDGEIRAEYGRDKVGNPFKDRHPGIAFSDHYFPEKDSDEHKAEKESREKEGYAHVGIHDPHFTKILPIGKKLNPPKYEEIIKHLEDAGYTDIDYLGNKAKNPENKREGKIGKLLKSNPALQEVHTKNLALINAGKMAAPATGESAEKHNKLADNYHIRFTRHPHEVYGQSADDHPWAAAYHYGHGPDIAEKHRNGEEEESQWGITSEESYDDHRVTDENGDIVEWNTHDPSGDRESHAVEHHPYEKKDNGKFHVPTLDDGKEFDSAEDAEQHVRDWSEDAYTEEPITYHYPTHPEHGTQWEHGTEDEDDIDLSSWEDDYNQYGGSEGDIIAGGGSDGSCLSITGGCYAEVANQEALRGTHSAYLHHKGDTKFSKPLARIAVRPYRNQDDSHTVVRPSTSHSGFAHNFDMNDDRESYMDHSEFEGRAGGADDSFEGDEIDSAATQSFYDAVSSHAKEGFPVKEGNHHYKIDSDVYSSDPDEYQGRGIPGKMSAKWFYQQGSGEQKEMLRGMERMPKDVIKDLVNKAPDATAAAAVLNNVGSKIALDKPMMKTMRKHMAEEGKGGEIAQASVAAHLRDFGANKKWYPGVTDEDINSLVNSDSPLVHLGLSSKGSSESDHEYTKKILTKDGDVKNQDISKEDAAHEAASNASAATFVDAKQQYGRYDAQKGQGGFGPSGALRRHAQTIANNHTKFAADHDFIKAGAFGHHDGLMNAAPKHAESIAGSGEFISVVQARALAKHMSSENLAKVISKGAKVNSDTRTDDINWDEIAHTVPPEKIIGAARHMSNEEDLLTLASSLPNVGGMYHSTDNTPEGVSYTKDFADGLDNLIMAKDPGLSLVGSKIAHTLHNKLNDSKNPSSRYEAPTTGEIFNKNYEEAGKHLGRLAEMTKGLSHDQARNLTKPLTGRYPESNSLLDHIMGKHRDVSSDAESTEDIRKKVVSNLSNLPEGWMHPDAKRNSMLDKHSGVEFSLKSRGEEGRKSYLKELFSDHSANSTSRVVSKEKEKAKTRDEIKELLSSEHGDKIDFGATSEGLKDAVNSDKELANHIISKIDSGNSTRAERLAGVVSDNPEHQSKSAKAMSGDELSYASKEMMQVGSPSMVEISANLATEGLNRGGKEAKAAKTIARAIASSNSAKKFKPETITGLRDALHTSGAMKEFVKDSNGSDASHLAMSPLSHPDLQKDLLTDKDISSSQRNDISHEVMSSSNLSAEHKEEVKRAVIGHPDHLDNLTSSIQDHQMDYARHFSSTGEIGGLINDGKFDKTNPSSVAGAIEKTTEENKLARLYRSETHRDVGSDHLVSLAKRHHEAGNIRDRNTAYRAADDQMEHAKEHEVAKLDTHRSIHQNILNNSKDNPSLSTATTGHSLARVLASPYVSKKTANDVASHLSNSPALAEDAFKLIHRGELPTTSHGWDATMATALHREKNHDDIDAIRSHANLHSRVGAKSGQVPGLESKHVASMLKLATSPKDKLNAYNNLARHLTPSQVTNALDLSINNREELQQSGVSKDNFLPSSVTTNSKLNASHKDKIANHIVNSINSGELDGTGFDDTYSIAPAAEQLDASHHAKIVQAGLDNEHNKGVIHSSLSNVAHSGDPAHAELIAKANTSSDERYANIFASKSPEAMKALSNIRANAINPAVVAKHHPEHLAHHLNNLKSHLEASSSTSGSKKMISKMVKELRGGVYSNDKHTQEGADALNDLALHPDIRKEVGGSALQALTAHPSKNVGSQMSGQALANHVINTEHPIGSRDLPDAISNNPNLTADHAQQMVSNLVHRQPESGLSNDKAREAYASGEGALSRALMAHSNKEIAHVGVQGAIHGAQNNLGREGLHRIPMNSVNNAISSHKDISADNLTGIVNLVNHDHFKNDYEGDELLNASTVSPMNHLADQKHVTPEHALTLLNSGNPYGEHAGIKTVLGHPTLHDHPEVKKAMEPHSPMAWTTSPTSKIKVKNPELATKLVKEHLHEYGLDHTHEKYGHDEKAHISEESHSEHTLRTNHNPQEHSGVRNNPLVFLKNSINGAVHDVRGKPALDAIAKHVANHPIVNHPKTPHSVRLGAIAHTYGSTNKHGHVTPSEEIQTHVLKNAMHINRDHKVFGNVEPRNMVTQPVVEKNASALDSPYHAWHSMSSESVHKKIADGSIKDLSQSHLPSKSIKAIPPKHINDTAIENPHHTSAQFDHSFNKAEEGHHSDSGLLQNHLKSPHFTEHHADKVINNALSEEAGKKALVANFVTPSENSIDARKADRLSDIAGHSQSVLTPNQWKTVHDGYNSCSKSSKKDYLTAIAKSNPAMPEHLKPTFGEHTDD